MGGFIVPPGFYFFSSRIWPRLNMLCLLDGVDGNRGRDGKVKLSSELNRDPVPSRGQFTHLPLIAILPRRESSFSYTLPSSPVEIICFSRHSPPIELAPTVPSRRQNLLLPSPVPPSPSHTVPSRQCRHSFPLRYTVDTIITTISYPVQKSIQGTTAAVYQE